MPESASAIKTSIQDHIGEIVISNPEKHNALDQESWLAVPRAVDDLIAQDVRVIVLSGEGASFCAGADITEFDVVRESPETARVYEKANEAAFAAIRNTSVPVIAKICGFCLGGGFGLAAAADIRIAETSASFSVPAAKLGLAYPVEAMADIVAAIGAQNTKRMLFAGQRFSAREMHGMGFLAEVLDRQQLDEHVHDLAISIAELAPLTHQATKASIEAALGGDIGRAAAIGGTTFDSADYAEGRAAFREKRKPSFTGN